MKKVFLGAVLVIGVLIATFFILNSYIYNEKQADTEGTVQASKEGEYICLPPKDQTMPLDECAAGLLTEEGYYAIDLGLLSGEVPALVEGQRLSANGIVTPIENLSTDYWDRFPVIGIFSVTDSLQIQEDTQGPAVTIYNGVLPCASCEGIDTTITLTASSSLNTGGTYVLTETYLGEDDAIVRTSGEWYIETRDDARYLVLLNVSEEVGAYEYRFESEDRIRFAGLDGSALASDLPYDLTRTQSALTAVRGVLDQEWAWTYTELKDGTRVEAPSGEEFILTLGSDGRYQSSTDCNAISGEFALEGEVVSFGPALSTRMFCEGSLETVYTNDLLLTNSYVINGPILRLNLDRDYGVMYFEAR